MNKDQTSWTLQRSYRVNLRRDIQDRRIALLVCQTVARCLETVDCCIVNRRQYLVMSLCPPSVHPVKHLRHDHRFVWVWRQVAKTYAASHGVD